MILWRKKNLINYTQENYLLQETGGGFRRADLCMIYTEWEEIKKLTPEIFCSKMKKPIILDGRNCYSVKDFENLPLVYDSIGRKTIHNI